MARYLRILLCLLGGCAAHLRAPAEPSAAPALVPTSVATRPDPFATLQALEAGRIASSWSSLPSGEGCLEGDQRLSAHAMLLAESSRAAQDVQPGLFSLVDTRRRLQIDGSAQRDCVFAQLAVQRQVGASGDYGSWDGSALSWRIDPHWRVGAGRIAHHWGPAWDGSLILGTAARPFPNASVAAASGPLARDGFWWWLGEIDFSAFFGRLEDERADYARPYLMGARAVVRPWPWLELAISRTAMWGGEGRDTSLKTFLKSVLGRDNSCSGGDCDTQPGNQLGGYDARLKLDRWLPGVGLYGQMIGEDDRPDDIPLPAKNMYLAGAEWRRGDALLFVEWTDSTAKAAGVAYNHFIYTDGYRYKGRPLGHWADGDSNLWSVGGLYGNLLGGQALAVVRYGMLNASGVNPTWPDARFAGASLQWRRLLDRVFGLSFVLDHATLSHPGRADGNDRRDTQLRLQLDAWID